MSTENQLTSITDMPRLSNQLDSFGIDPYEKGLIKFIKGSCTPITIALQGEWGSGKTSLMYTLKQQLADTEKAPFYAIWLNTWEFALMKDAPTALVEILYTLTSEVARIMSLDENKTTKLLNNINTFGQTVLKIAAKATAERFVPGSGEAIESFYRKKKDSVIAELRDDLEKTINENLSKVEKKGIIFFIDDLDRIDPPAAVQLLELLKNIFTLNNCIFILALDYDVVVKGLKPKFGELTEKNEREFRSFFDKIIQVPFSMPVDKYKIDTFLKESLLNTAYISKEQAANAELMTAFTQVCNLSIGTNPRALKRLLNSISLIKCINEADNPHGLFESSSSTDQVELLANFAMVSIQIAFPQVYRALSLYPAFDQWNEAVAMQLNLKPLENQGLAKIKEMEEFDELWEQILFRLCEPDYYLKKKSLHISRLLNLLKDFITIKNTESLEDVITTVISLSSVTSVESQEKPRIEYHTGDFLKAVRYKLVDQILKINNATKINYVGKRVQTNAVFGFGDDSWPKFYLKTHVHGGQVRLKILTEYWFPALKQDNLTQIIAEAGLTNQFEEINNRYETIRSSFKQYEILSLTAHITKNYNSLVLHIWVNIDMQETNNFYSESNLKPIAELILKLKDIQIEIADLGEKVKQFYAIK